MSPAAGPTRSGVITHVRFSVLELLKGAVAGDADLGLQPSSEEFEYVVGQRVLVYAVRGPTGWVTACTRTTRVAVSDSEVAVLRAVRNRRPGGAIDGTATTVALARANRAGGVRVLVRRDTAVVAQMTTDNSGRFQSPWLAPGIYTLSIDDAARGITARREVVVSADGKCVSLGWILRPQP